MLPTITLKSPTGTKWLPAESMIVIFCVSFSAGSSYTPEGFRQGRASEAVHVPAVLGGLMPVHPLRVLAQEIPRLMRRQEP